MEVASEPRNVEDPKGESVAILEKHSNSPVVVCFFTNMILLVVIMINLFLGADVLLPIGVMLVVKINPKLADVGVSWQTR